jgi:hypothetical protein
MHWNIHNFSLTDICRDFGYTIERARDPLIAPDSYEVKDADGNILVIGRVWELWTWFGEEIGL